MSGYKKEIKVVEAFRELGIAADTYYRWLKEHKANTKTNNPNPTGTDLCLNLKTYPCTSNDIKEFRNLWSQMNNSDTLSKLKLVEKQPDFQIEYEWLCNHTKDTYQGTWTPGELVTLGALISRFLRRLDAVADHINKQEQERLEKERLEKQRLEMEEQARRDRQKEEAERQEKARKLREETYLTLKYLLEDEAYRKNIEFVSRLAQAHDSTVGQRHATQEHNAIINDMNQFATGGLDVSPEILTKRVERHIKQVAEVVNDAIAALRAKQEAEAASKQAQEASVHEENLIQDAQTSNHKKRITLIKEIQVKLGNLSSPEGRAKAQKLKELMMSRGYDDLEADRAVSDLMISGEQVIKALSNGVDIEKLSDPLHDFDLHKHYITITSRDLDNQIKLFESLKEVTEQPSDESESAIISIAW